MQPDGFLKGCMTVELTIEFMNNYLTLRTLTSPFSGDVTVNSVLSHADLDSNFIYLKNIASSGSGGTGTALVTKIVLSDASTTNWNFASGTFAEWTINGNHTLNISNLPTGYVA